MADQNKTEQATPQHRKKARDRGQVTRSRELTSALGMTAVAGTMILLGRQAMPQWAHFFRTSLDLASSDAIEPGGSGPGAGTAQEASAPETNLFAAVEQQLGLKLVPRKVARYAPVIDHAQAVPAEN